MTDEWVYRYRAKVIEVHDGDTVIFDTDLGFGIRLPGLSWSGKTELSMRVAGINAPELRTAAGRTALGYAQTLLAPGEIVPIVSHHWDKYGGRFDGSITLPDGRDFAQAMLDAGQAEPFMVGGG